jgi:hypothetical protein
LYFPWFGKSRKTLPFFLMKLWRESSLRPKKPEDMPVNGLLLTLSPDESLARQARATIAARAEAVLGEPQGIYQPLAVETDDVRGAHEFHEWLESLEGVGHVDVIYVGFEEPSATAP